MAVEELTDIMEYDEAHYFGINNEIVLGGVITEMTESSNPTESEKQYIHQKSKTKKITGFSNEFPITMDMVKGDKVFDYKSFPKLGDMSKMTNIVKLSLK